MGKTEWGKNWLDPTLYDNLRRKMRELYRSVSQSEAPHRLLMEEE